MQETLGHHDHVPPLVERLGGEVPQAVNLLVDGGVLFDVGVRRRQVGFRLVVVVVGDEVAHRVVGEELPEFAGELRGECLVVGDDQGGALDARAITLAIGEGLAGAGHPQQRLPLEARAQAVGQLLDRLRLIALGAELGDEFELLLRHRNPLARDNENARLYYIGFRGSGLGVRRVESRSASLRDAEVEESGRPEVGCTVRRAVRAATPSALRSSALRLPGPFSYLLAFPLCAPLHLYKTVCQAPPVGPLFLLSLPSRGQHLAHVSFGDTRRSRFRRQEGHHSNRPLWALTSHRRASELRTGEPHNPLLSSTSDQAHKWRVLPRRFPTPPPLLGCISRAGCGWYDSWCTSKWCASVRRARPSCILAGFLPCLKATRVCNCRKCGSKSLRRLAACAARPTALRRYRFPRLVRGP